MMLVLSSLFLLFVVSQALVTRRPLTVLITGCSSGIGKATAIELAKHPQFKVWATMRNVESWKETVENVQIAQLDVTSESSIGDAMRKILEKDNNIDVLINNAGFGLAGCLEVAHVDEGKQLFDVNVWGPVRMMQAVLPHMRKNKRGYIINISSTSGIRGIPCMEYYTGSKFALEGITDSMRYSLAPFNISITNVNAGPVRTGFTDRFGHATDGGRGTRMVEDETGYLQALTDRIAAGVAVRMQQENGGQSSEEIATVIFNLLSIAVNAKRITDIPFNIGTSYDSQKILEEVRRHPTGWGGIFNDILSSIPSLESRNEMARQRRDEEERRKADNAEL